MEFIPILDVDCVKWICTQPGRIIEWDASESECVRVNTVCAINASLSEKKQ